MKQSSRALIALTLLAVVATSLYSQGQTQNQTPRPARSRADEMLRHVERDRQQTYRHGRRIFPKTSTTSSCRKTSAPSRRIFSTPPHSITS